MNEQRRGTADRAIETATDRTRAAEDEFLKTPLTDDAALGRAAKVERRAEDLAALAADPVEEEPPPAAEAAEQGGR